MRRLNLGLLASAVALLASCGASTPQLVFDSATRPPSTTTTSPTPAASSTSSPTAPAQTTSTVEVFAEPPPPATSPASSVADETPIDTTPIEPTTSAPVDPPPACDAAGCSGAQIVDYPSLTAVPQLGEDPVRGSGCGLADEFGDSMRDGLYFGVLYPSADDVGFDVICVYYGDAAVDKGADPGAASDFFPVNVGTRQRDVPLGDAFVYRVGTWTADGQCIDAGPLGDADWASADDGVAAWLMVSGGEATGAVAMCPI